MNNQPLVESLMSEISNDDIAYIKSMTPGTGDITRNVLENLRKGDHEAFCLVYVRWRKPIYSFLFRLLGSESEADDITQDVFTNLWVIRERIDTDKNIKTYLYLMARQSAIKHFEKQKVRQNYAVKSIVEEADYFTSHEIVVEKELMLIREIMLEKMPKHRSQIFKMSYDEGLANDEIASRLNITKETVYNQLSIARKEIRDIFTLCLILFFVP